ncbi:PEP motif putative anchor domain protein [Desulfovibrio sp. X2]|uniref:PEP-CTERM sorting domain-containing protein n=1 Tax=Desulfovibrio sp. X2 TaxID=941449 RepID=UPI000358AC64|nr:PEP-CTERM sorting domain-containing protein [Desulfovibrio sp. X2]EPR37257.1 PEP motif putative anchor domain protein [Desulfovibrio sp. X2]
MKKCFYALAVLAAVLLATGAYATTVVSFTDTYVTWPGYSSSISKDVNGIPDLLGGSFTFDNHTLVGISLEYTVSTTSGWSSLKPGDWFFDINNDNVWDYVLHSSNSRSAGSWMAYEVAIPLTDGNPYNNNNYWGTDYIFSSGSGTRQGQPVEARISGSDSKLGWVDYSGFTKPVWNSATHSYSIETAYWDLSGIEKPIVFDAEGGYFGYGFTMTCANDVIYGHGPLPAPEPGTLLLLLGGLPAVAAYRRMRAA